MFAAETGAIHRLYSIFFIKHVIFPDIMYVMHMLKPGYYITSNFGTSKYTKCCQLKWLPGMETQQNNISTEFVLWVKSCKYDGLSEALAKLVLLN